MGMSTMLFLIPYYLIAGRDFTPDRAGLLLVALPIPMAIVAPISGFLSDRIGTRLPAVAGMAIMASGCFMLTRLTPESNLTYLISALAIAGLGTGIFISPNNSALMGAATRAQQGVAAGVRATARNVGNVLGIGMAGAIFNEVMLQNHGLNEGISVSRGVDTGLLAAFIAILLGTAASAMQQNEKSTDRHASTAQLD
jgi:MFS family permease